MTDKTLEALEREQFERWRNDYFGPLHTNVESNAMWTAWQARAALAAPVVEAAQTGRGQMAAPQDGMQFWLWKNGDHFLAFTHLYPCFTPGGDPMVLGEPVGRAVFKRSFDRACAALEAGAPTTGVARMTDAECWEQGKPDSIDRAMAAERRDVSPQPVAPGRFELTRSIIHACPAIKLPQSWAEQLGMTAQIVALKGADDAIAERIVHALNAARPPAAEAEPVAWGSFFPSGVCAQATANPSAAEGWRRANGDVRPLFLAAPLQQPQEGWVSVEERLPEVSDWYLVTIADPQDIGWETKRPWMAWFEAGEWLNCDPISDGQPVTHWRPALTAAAPSQGEGEG